MRIFIAAPGDLLPALRRDRGGCLSLASACVPRAAFPRRLGVCCFGDGSPLRLSVRMAESHVEGFEARAAHVMGGAPRFELSCHAASFGASICRDPRRDAGGSDLSACGHLCDATFALPDCGELNAGKTVGFPSPGEGNLKANAIASVGFTGRPISRGLGGMRRQSQA